MYKSKKEIIVIQAEAADPITTGVVFWSHDKGTAKLQFQLQKDSLNQALPTGTVVPILLEFNSKTAEGGRGRHIYNATIEDSIEGIVSIVLEDNILGYQGRVDGSIYIELPDSRSLDTAGRFTFEIKRSPIDVEIPELEDYYWQGFNAIMEQFHNSIDDIISESKETLDKVSADILELQNKSNVLNKAIADSNANLQSGIDDIKRKIEDNDVYTKQESSANVIDLVQNDEAINEHFESAIARNRIENLATQAEAETGQDNAKTMTPLRTVQAINKQTVTIAGNQVVGGIKNFKDGLMSNGAAVLTVKSASQTFDSSNMPDTIQSGSIKFTRNGQYVIGYLNFQVRADRDIVQDRNVFYGLNDDLVPESEFMDSVSSYGGASTLVNMLSNRMTARTALSKNTWYVGRIFYKAKN